MTRDWADCTVITQNEINEVILELDGEQDKEISIHSYQIEFNSKGNISEEKALEFISDEFPKFVLTHEERQELNEKEMHDEARERGQFRDINQDGKYGEILMFLLMEGYFDIPIVCHKVSAKQSYKHEVKGSDGLFYGEFKGESVLGVGEAKFYSSNWNQALNNALDSVKEFHGDKSKRKWKEDLNIASKTITEENFSEEQVETLQGIFDGGKDSTKILHPVFVGYQDKENLQQIQINSDNREDAKDKLEDLLEKEERLKKTKDKVQERANNLRKHTLLFMFFPVENVSEFKMKMVKQLYPGIGKVIEEEFEEED